MGVDTLVSDIYRMRKKIQEKVLWAILLGTLWALILGFWLSKKLTGSLRGLSRGIRSVSRGDLKYKIDVRGNDEIAELSRDFNRMAEDLNRTHQKNQAYFYGVIRSLVTILEARDLTPVGTRSGSPSFRLTWPHKWDLLPTGSKC